MRKIFGNWLMDIAKYVTTAVVISTIFSSVTHKWVVILSGLLTIVVTLGIGLWLIRDKEERN